MNPLFQNDRQGELPNSWYAATADIPAPRAALDGEVSVDVAILGAGYTGLTCAWELAQKGLSVAVVDAHRVGFGASGRNGGQAGSGFNMDQRELERSLGEGPARMLWDLSMEAKAMVRDFCDTHAPEARFTPGVAHGAWSRRDFNDLRAYADHLAQHYGFEEEVYEGDAFRDIVQTPVYQGGTLDRDAGHIHPLRYVLALARAAEAAGAVIYERSTVVKLAPGALHTEQGTLRAKDVVIAGNGYMPALHTGYAARVCPINSFIAATEPLPDPSAVLSQDVAVADDRFVVNYFRLSHDKRLLFGGGESYGYRFPRDIAAKVRKPMTQIFPHLRDVPIDYAWGGTLAITMKRLPYLVRLGPNILSASGYSGHGVGTATHAGQLLAQAVQGDGDGFDTMAAIPTMPFPGGAAMRMPLLILAMTWYSLRDRLGL